MHIHTHIHTHTAQPLKSTLVIQAPCRKPKPMVPNRGDSGQQFVQNGNPMTQHSEKQHMTLQI